MAAPSSLLRAGFRSARDALNCGERCRIPVSALQFQAAAGNFFPRTLQQLQQPSECADFSTESGSAAGEMALPAHNSVTMPPSFDARAADAAVAAAAASSGAATSDAASSGAAAVTSGTDGSRAVLAKLLNVPRMVLKEELLRSFCNPALTSADVFTVLDDRLHTLHWYGGCSAVWCDVMGCGAVRYNGFDLVLAKLLNVPCMVLKEEVLRSGGARCWVVQKGLESRLLLNVPRMVLKEEDLRSFRNPALTSADVFTVLDDRLHTLHWYIVVWGCGISSGAAPPGAQGGGSVVKLERYSTFRNAALTSTDVLTVLDDQLHTLHWQMEFKSPEDYSKARELVELYKREGSRIRLQELSPRDHELAFHKKHHNWELRHWRDVSLILTGLPDDVKTDDIEQFFEDYMLHPPAVYHVRIERRGVPTPMRLRMKGETRPIVDLVERRAVVRFANQLEALRALREKHREFVGDRMVELSLLQ
ncbi:unnamed protein product [Closterium sp. NIES-65]|nr:unnamed protein product [Closterium sp. NIES-65]